MNPPIRNQCTLHGFFAQAEVEGDVCLKNVSLKED